MLMAVLYIFGIDIGFAQLRKDGVVKLEAGRGRDMAAAIAHYFPDTSKPWAIKDLRLAEDGALLDTYPTAKVVHLYRASESRTSPEEDWLEIQDANREAVKVVLAAHPSVEAYFLDYDAVVAHPVLELIKLASFLGIQPPPAARAKIAAFVTADGMDYDEMNTTLWQQ